MIIKPIFTEKTMKLAKEGKYSFWTKIGLTKYQIKGLIEKMFSVVIADIKTANYKKEIKRNFRGKKVTKSAKKRVVVSLKSGKLDMFEESSS